MQFGPHLRALRRAAGLTQEELAECAGLTANGVSALERGARTRPYPHTVRSLADALGVASDERLRFMAAPLGAPRGVPRGERLRFMAAATTGANGRGPVDAGATHDRRGSTPGPAL